MPIKIAINGFGRIGRAAFKVAISKKKYQVVAINDLISPDVAAYLLQYDTVYGRYPHTVKSDKKNLIVDGMKYLITNIKEPAKLPWKKLKVDVALECTGRFINPTDLALHLKAGAKKAILSAPAKGEETATYILGVNVKGKLKQDVVSNASCTTNCVSPVAEVIVSAFGVKKAMMTTVHANTAEQSLVDGPPPALHHDLRRGRAAGHNIVPTSTGAAKAAALVVPELKGLFDGMALRVPISCGSISDFTFLLKKKVTVQQVNTALKRAALSTRYKGILETTTEPLVSSDIVGNPASAIVDLSLTQVVDGDLVKVVAWYDNEWGYANRLVELAEKFK